MLLCFVFVCIVSFSSLHFFSSRISFTQRRSICSCHFTFIGNCSVIECDMIAMIVLVSCTLFYILPFMPVFFFMGISIAFCSFFFSSIVLNVASHRAASKCYLMTSKEIDWNQIVKAVALLMFECVWC